MIKNKFLAFSLLLLTFSCGSKETHDNISTTTIESAPIINNTSLVILGTIQDAGSPQIGCKKECCAHLFNEPDSSRQIVSLGLIDVPNEKTYLFEATPDIVQQMKRLTQFESQNEKEIVDGIFLTHAHIGHYTGLMYLGKEAMNANNVPVYAMPRMIDFLRNNGPWDQLVKTNNIELSTLEKDKGIKVSEEIQITPFLVPHRDEYSETVGYRIQGPSKSALFIPDIDKWEKWEKDIVEEIRRVDYAFLDATFFSGKEMNNRDISEIPHPFIIESLEKFKDLDPKDKNKIIFIHFNHTNPVINLESEEAKEVIELGYNIGQNNDVFEL